MVGLHQVSRDVIKLEVIRGQHVGIRGAFSRLGKD